MKILLDHQIFSWQKYGGISNSYAETFAIWKNQGVEVDLGLKYSFNGYLHEMQEKLPGAKIISPRAYERAWPLPGNFRGRTRLQNKFAFGTQNIFAENSNYTGELLASGKYDVFQTTYYDPYFLPLLGGVPYVLAVYDLTHELYPELFANAAGEIANKAKVLARASRITTISQKVKDDLISFYHVEPEKIDVVYLASPLTRVTPASDKQVEGDYLLYVGERSKYKNWEFAVGALAPVLRERKLKLISAGGGVFTDEEKAIIAHWGLQDLVFHRNHPEPEKLAALYRDAKAFIYPSYAEGFGIPLIEAFNFGCPVLTSNASCLPEIAADAALLLDPKDPEAWRSATNKVLDDEALRQDLIIKGKSRGQHFSFEKMAAELLQTYQKVIGA